MIVGQPDMEDDIEKWFSVPAHGADWQDADLILADAKHLPLMKKYLDDASAVEFKKVVVISAFLELLEHECSPGKSKAKERLADDIKATIRKHADIARKAMHDLAESRRQ